MVKNLERVMTINFFSRYFEFKGPKIMKQISIKSGARVDHDLRPNCAWDKKVEENRPLFLLNGGLLSNF